MNFAQTLEKLMEATEMTNYRLSQKLQCHQTTVAAWREKGAVPRKAMIAAIADVFGITKEQLMGEAPIDYDSLTKEKPKPSAPYQTRLEEIQTESTDEIPRSESDEIIEEIYNDPYARALFYTMKGATPEEYRQAAEIVKMIRRSK